MKLQFYSKKELNQYVRDAVTQTMEGMMEWITDHTDIVDDETGKVLDNASLTSKPDGKSVSDVVFSKLKEKGIEFIKLESKKK